MRATEVIGVVRVMSNDTLERVAALLGVEADRFEVLHACFASRTARKKLAAFLFDNVTGTPRSDTKPAAPVAPMKPRRLGFV